MTHLIPSLAVGTVMGIALEKGGVSDQVVIRKQMAFRSSHMMKLFLMATSVSLLVASFLENLGFNVAVKETNLPANIIGGLLIGVGMTIGGACPGTVYSELGSGRPGALASFLGGVVAVLLETLTGGFDQFKAAYSDGVVTIHRSFGVPHWMIGIPFALVLVLLAVFLDFKWPWRLEMKYKEVSKDILSLRSRLWSPFVCGLLIGLIQLPIAISYGRYLGTSAGLVPFCATCCMFCDEFVFGQSSVLTSAYTQECSGGSWWMTALVVGIGVGAWISSRASQAPKNPGVGGGQNRFASFIGGFLVIVGARIAGGCTSGHGLSGMGTLAVSGFVATAAIFIGGFITSLFIDI